MTAFQCTLEDGEKIYLSDLQKTIVQSPFEDVQVFNDTDVNDGIVFGSNTEGRRIPICYENEFIVFDTNI